MFGTVIIDAYVKDDTENLDIPFSYNRLYHNQWFTEIRSYLREWLLNTILQYMII